MAEAIHLTALGLWLGIVVMTGAAAAVLFPTLKKLNPTLPDFAAYNGEHWRIAAGKPASTLFSIADSAQLMCALLAVVSVLVLIFFVKVPVRRPAMLIRLGALALAMAALGFELFFLAPGMWTSLAAFWTAAAAGQNEVAEKFRAAFDADHPRASATLSATAACVFVSLFTGAWVAATHDAAPRRVPPTSASPEQSKPVIETPLLARSPRR